ncbi:MAG: tauA [Acidobacteria bacterium]|nr:tauA [Acidobacteriota bacterium]
MTEQPARLTLLGKLISIALIVGLIGFGAYLVMKRSPGGKIFQGAGSGESQETEAPDTAGVTTVKEYKYIPRDKLPAVKGVSQYRWDAKEKILRFSYNVWAGWLPVIAANRGTKPNTDSVFYKKYGFRVDMVLMDDPIAARDAFAAGEVHTLWGTADMMVLLAPELIKDSRTAPRIMQQVDWSSGGDGIVVRSSIKSASDLRNKTVTLAQNSPSEYYLTSLLLSAGLRPSDLKVKYTATAFEAAAAFVADRRVDACVSWAPDIYRIPERVAGTRVLSSTSDANKLIADVYAVRADFARDHPEIVEGLVSGIFEGMDAVKQNPAQAAGWMADAFGMKPDEVMSMRNDAHPTNFAENVQFFLNASNPTNFERTWKNASYIYRELGRIDAPVPFDQVMDFSVLQKLQKSGAFAHQKDESIAAFTPSSFRKVPAESPILTQTIRINFFPNSANPYEPARDEYGNAVSGKLYDPNVDATLEQVARLSGQFARAVILIEGHADSSMKGRVPVQAVRELSLARAEAIRRALVEKFKFDPNKFSIQGKGWEVPADSNDPNNQVLNRRVEISVFPPEQK